MATIFTHTAAFPLRKPAVKSGIFPVWKGFFTMAQYAGEETDAMGCSPHRVLGHFDCSGLVVIRPI
jgi:hypothetical protein